MAGIVTSPGQEYLYRLYYRCWDACQDPDDPYGRKPTHQCYEVISYPITKVAAKRIYFRDEYGRIFFIGRDAFNAEGTAYHRKIRERLHLTRPERPTRSKPKTISELRREMAAAHPDRGGSNEGFIAARQRYVRAVGR